MDQPNPAEITLLLGRIGSGDQAAEERLAELTYDELRRTAQQLMRRERHGTLQPTALVNEAYLRLTGDTGLRNSPNRSYFFAAAAQAMRRILVDAARRRRSQKAGGEFHRVPFEHLLDVYEQRSIDLVALDEALDELETLNSRQHRVVDLRWFGGFAVPDVAEILGVSVSTVESDWRLARAFLMSRVHVGDEPHG